MKREKNATPIEKENLVILITLCVFVLSLLLIIVCNIRNNSSFWDASLISCLSFAATVFISYLFVQWQTGRRNRNVVLVDLLMSLKQIISNPDAYSFTEDTSTETVLMRKRDISNHISILEEHKGKLGICAEVVVLKSRFSEYDEFIGDHIADMQYLSASRKELRRPLDLMISTLYEIMFKIQ